MNSALFGFFTSYFQEKNKPIVLYLQEIKGSSPAMQTAACYFVLHASVLICLNFGSVLIPVAHAIVVIRSGARCHPATDQLSEQAFLSDSPLSPSEYRDLAIVITSAEAFNCFPHSTSEGFRKAVKMPQGD